MSGIVGPSDKCVNVRGPGICERPVHMPTIGAERTQAVAERILADYPATQGLQLTRWQIQQLWRLDVTECDAVVKTPVEARFLRESRDGAFVRTERTGGFD